MGLMEKYLCYAETSPEDTERLIIPLPHDAAAPLPQDLICGWMEYHQKTNLLLY